MMCVAWVARRSMTRSILCHPPQIQTLHQIRTLARLRCMSVLMQRWRRLRAVDVLSRCAQPWSPSFPRDVVAQVHVKINMCCVQVCAASVLTPPSSWLPDAPAGATTEQLLALSKGELACCSAQRCVSLNWKMCCRPCPTRVWVSIQLKLYFSGKWR